MDSSELTQITSIVENVKNANFNRIQAENRKMHQLLKVARDALKLRQSLDETYSRPQTYPNQTDVKGVTSTSKDVPEEQSHFELDRCKKVFQDYGVTDGEFIDRTCSEYLGAQPLQSTKKKGATYNQIMMQLVNKGLSSARALKIANELFGKKTGERIEKTDWVAHDKGGGKSRSTTYYPSASGFKKNPQTLETLQTITKTKSASVAEIAPWAVLHGGIHPGEEIEQSSNLRSASKAEAQNYLIAQSEGAVGALESLANSRKQKVESNNLKNASLEDEKPSWLVCYESRGY